MYLMEYFVKFSRLHLKSAYIIQPWQDQQPQKLSSLWQVLFVQQFVWSDKKNKHKNYDIKCDEYKNNS